MINFLFLKVLNMSITASVVILFVLAARFLLRRLPKIFSYLLWGIVIFRLICPFSFTVPFSLLDLTNSNSGCGIHMDFGNIWNYVLQYSFFCTI